MYVLRDNFFPIDLRLAIVTSTTALVTDVFSTAYVVRVSDFFLFFGERMYIRIFQST